MCVKCTGIITKMYFHIVQGPGFLVKWTVLLFPSSSICRNFLIVLTPGSNSLYRVVHFNGGVTWYKWSLIGEGGTVETRWLYMVWRGYHSYSQQQTGMASLLCEWVGLLQVMRLGSSMGKRKCSHMYQDIFASQVSDLHTLTSIHWWI